MGVEAALEYNTGSLFSLREEEETNMEIDSIIEDLEREQSRMEEVRPEPISVLFSEWRVHQRNDPWIGKQLSSRAGITTPCLRDRGW